MKYRIAKRINPLNNESKFYPAPQYMEELTLMDLAKDISDACTLNVTDVDAVLTSLLRKLPMYLKSGFKIQLGNFGRMKLSFSSKGFDNPDDVDSSAITTKRIIFTPSTELKTEIESVSFSKL
ncbi:MAG: DNA-binding protein [Treponema porcinum]|uniref:HU family DNA-binding protein n=1 Tax=Treponema porcinum TaxID=261392 RepID=UPI00235705BF|nr:DNA-binding protein [Treponema porcinum]MCI6482218.1 DNA-binding protein [Treponema porcinum]MCI7109740.1 DNA-binding protein [Spirochaetia bacterium]MDY5121215.1 DNA-binding protein [Treponema porcinum]MDY5817703.1 DNA-binding protein [Treponema sp.]